jgi:hypothetical protein
LENNLLTGITKLQGNKRIKLGDAIDELANESGLNVAEITKFVKDSMDKKGKEQGPIHELAIRGPSAEEINDKITKLVKELEEKKAKEENEKMPAGKYYIGDLRYVMYDDEWMEWERGLSCGLEGIFTLKDGRRFASFNTGGGGKFESNIGTRHCVDSGFIGCILVEDIEKKDEMGAIVEFTEPFKVKVSKRACEIVFGHVKIDTSISFN